MTSDPRDQAPEEPAEPYDIETEQAVIGAMMLAPAAFWSVAEFLKPEHFYDPVHGRLWTAIEKLAAADRAITPTTLRAATEGDPGWTVLNAREYLAGCAQLGTSGRALVEYGQLLRELAARRRLIAIGRELIEAGNSPFAQDGETAEVIADRAADELFEAARSRKQDEGAVPIRELAMRAAQEAENAMNAPDSAALGSGLYLVDQEVGKLYRGDLTVLAAPPNMGKSALAHHIAKSVAALETEEEVIFFSQEMKAVQLAMRELAHRSGVTSDRMRSGKIKQEEAEIIALAAYQMADIPYRIDGGRSLSVAQMRARVQARRRRSKKGVSLVVIDHLRFIRAANKRDDEKDQIQQITRDLADMAAEFNVAVLLISHVNREFSKRVSQRPVLSDLYGSSAIEQNADSVWFIHREIYYLLRNPPAATLGLTKRAEWEDACEREAGFAEIYSAKVRMGSIGTARVKFIEKFTAFADAEPAPMQEVLDLLHTPGAQP